MHIIPENLKFILQIYFKFQNILIEIINAVIYVYLFKKSLLYFSCSFLVCMDQEFNLIFINVNII